MSKLRFLTDFLAFSDVEQTNNPKDQTMIKITTEESNFSALVRNKITIANSIVDQSISIAESNSEYLLVYTDQEITIKIDGSGDARVLTPSAVGIKTLCYFERGDISTMTVSNSSGNSANLDIITIKL